MGQFSIRVPESPPKRYHAGEEERGEQGQRSHWQSRVVSRTWRPSSRTPVDERDCGQSAWQYGDDGTEIENVALIEPCATHTYS